MGPDVVLQVTGCGEGLGAIRIGADKGSLSCVHPTVDVEMLGGVKPLPASWKFAFTWPVRDMYLLNVRTEMGRKGKCPPTAWVVTLVRLVLLLFDRSGHGYTAAISCHHSRASLEHVLVNDLSFTGRGMDGGTGHTPRSTFVRHNRVNVQGGLVIQFHITLQLDGVHSSSHGHLLEHGFSTSVSSSWPPSSSGEVEIRLSGWAHGMKMLVVRGAAGRGS